jgi:hypothetical protein
MNKLKAPAGRAPWSSWRWPAAVALVKLALAGGAVWFTASKTLYNVEGGHRSIVFNRLKGIKDKVTPIRPPLPPESHFSSSS